VDVAVVDVLVVATCTYIGRADTIGPRHRVARALLQAIRAAKVSAIDW